MSAQSCPLPALASGNRIKTVRLGRKHLAALSPENLHKLFASIPRSAEIVIREER